MILCKNLTKTYWPQSGSGEKHEIAAVQNVNISLRAGASYALVGESGSGKSTLARLLACVERPTSGELYLDEIQSVTYKPDNLRQYRKNVQLVLQDSQSALDPSMKIFDSIAEPMRCLLKLNKMQTAERVHMLTERVGLTRQQLSRRPHELSGGQQKRVCIARALGVSPRLIIFDESTSGLDVTIRKQILDLLKNIQKEEKCAFFFITHDIDVAMYMADSVFVMKDGSVVETVQDTVSTESFRHEYSKMLIAALPPKAFALAL